VIRIALPALPEAVPAQASAGIAQLLPLSLFDLSRELAELALRDERFDRAAVLAADLQLELARLSGEPAPARARRLRARARREARPQHTSERLPAFTSDVEALGSAC